MGSGTVLQKEAEKLRSACLHKLTPRFGCCALLAVCVFSVSLNSLETLLSSTVSVEPSLHPQCERNVWEESLLHSDACIWRLGYWHAEIRKKENLPAVMWSVSRSLAGCGAAPRAIDVIDLTYSRFHKKCTEDGQIPNSDDGLFDHCSWYVDISQEVGRRAYTDGRLRALCGGTTYYSYQRQRLLLPEEHLMCMGWARGSYSREHISDHSLRDLAGESMAPPAIGLVVASLCLSISNGIWSERD